MPAVAVEQSGNDSNAQSYLDNAPRQLHQTKYSYVQSQEPIEGKFSTKVMEVIPTESTKTGVIIVTYHREYYIRKIDELEVIVRDQQIKLSEYERKRRFAPRRRRLPADYHENPIYLDE